MNDLLDVTQVAKALKLPQNTVRWRLRKGFIIGAKLGRDWVVQRADLRKSRKPKRGCKKK